MVMKMHLVSMYYDDFLDVHDIQNYRIYYFVFALIFQS